MPPKESPDTRSVDPATARAAFTRAARGAVGVWLLALAAGLLSGVGGLLLMLSLALSVGYGQAAAWAMACFVGLTFGLYPIVPAFVPRSVPDATGVPLQGDDLNEVAAWVRSHAGVRYSDIKVVTEPAVWITLKGGLRLGIGLVACLREDELAALVRLAQRTDASMTRVQRLAMRLVYGDIGRDAPFVTRGLARWLTRRLPAVAEARGLWVAAEEAGGADDHLKAAVSGRRVVAEGWDMLVDQYLWPALLVGAWHDDPWTGLRMMLAAWEEIGADVWPARGESGGGFAADALPGVMRHESESARLILPTAWPHDDEPTAWEERPDRIDERMLRHKAALTLDAARIATGRAVPATFNAFCAVLEGGWAPTVAGILGIGPGDDDQPPLDDVVPQMLTEIATLALLDASAASLTWSWTRGSTLVDPHGQLVDVPAAVRHHHSSHDAIDVVRLRAWVRRHGGDPSAPVLLEEGLAPAPEAPVLEFGAVRLLRPQRVVLTTHALRFFGDKKGATPSARPSNELASAQASAATLREDPHEIAPCYPLEEIVSAEVSPFVTRVRHWRLTVRTKDRTRSVWTSEDRDTVIPSLEAALGERLSLTWWALPAPVRWARNVWGFVFSAVGGVSVLLGLLFMIDPTDGMAPGLGDQTVMIVGGSLVYALAYLPEWVLRLFRGRTSRRLAPLRLEPHDPRS